MGAEQSTSTDMEKWVNEQVKLNLVVVFSKTYCPFCTKAKTALKNTGLRDFTVFELDKMKNADDIMDVLKKQTGARTVPRVFINGTFIGGGDDVMKLQSNGQLERMLTECGAL